MSFSGITEEALDEIEKQMRDKIGIQTGYGDKEVQARQLEKLFRYFDVGEFRANPSRGRERVMVACRNCVWL